MGTGSGDLLIVTLTCESGSAPPMSVVRVAGEVDTAAAPELRNQLRYAASSSSSDEVVVVLAAVTFMNCRGFGVLLEARADLGDRLLLQAPSGPVRRLLDLVEPWAHFHVVHDDAALPGVVARLSERGARLVGDGERQAAALQASLRRRAVYEQATGLTMSVHGCSAPHARQLMVRAAREHGVPVSDLARALTEPTDTVEGSSAPTPGLARQWMLAVRARDGAGHPTPVPASNRLHLV